jgi:hypothetical protein
MHKRDYFVLALAKGFHLHKDWILDAFSIVAESHDGKEDPLVLEFKEEPQIRRLPSGYYVADIDGKWEPLEGTERGKPAFSFSELVDLKKGDVANLNENIKTTYGNALLNAVVLVYSCGTKIPYINKRVAVKHLEPYFLKMTDKPKSESDITVEEYLKFGQAMYSLAGLTQLCVPSATAKTMTSDPRINEVRAELLEKYKDQLHDPVIIAKIDKVLVDLDRAWLKGDPGEGFYIKDKSYNVVRKRLYGMYGGEDAFGDGTHVTLIEKSLNDGWDITKLPVMASSLREGSFNRGHQTELGGAIAKEMNRYCTNSTISEEDCGTKLGLPVTLDADGKKRYLNNYAFVDGKEVLFTEENIDSFVGKKVEVRSPVYCKTGGIDYCVHCMGPLLAESPNSLGVQVADIGQNFMLTSMGMMHGTQLATAPWKVSLEDLTQEMLDYAETNPKELLRIAGAETGPASWDMASCIF